METVGYRTIRDKENDYLQRALRSWDEDPRILVLGDLRARRLPIVSFLLRQGSGYLHHDYVTTLLSDLFGIQVRGGCSCAGPYGHDLLGITGDARRDLERELLAGQHGLKPGWTRLSFAYYTSEAEFEYIVRAVRWVAAHGFRLLDDYLFDPQSGSWTHVDGPRPTVTRLGGFRYAGSGRAATWQVTLPESTLEGCLDYATSLVECRRLGSAAPAKPLPPSFERLRWFPVPASLRAASPLGSRPCFPVLGPKRTGQARGFWRTSRGLAQNQRAPDPRPSRA